MYLICVCCCGDRGVKNIDVRVPNSRAVPAPDHYRDGSTLENGSIGENSLEDPSAYHQSRSFANQNGYYSRNLSAAMETEMVMDPRELKPRMLPPTAGGEMKLVPAVLPAVAISTQSDEEDQSQTRSKLSNTSSNTTPKSSFDEILPLSELADEFTEKIEPNGKVYFVAQTAEERERAREENATQRRAMASEPGPIVSHAEPISLTVEKETSKAIAFLDNILDDEDTVVSGEEPPSSGEYVRTRANAAEGEAGEDDEDDDGASSSLASPVFREQSVVADIHRTLDSIGESSTGVQPNEPSLPVAIPVVIPVTVPSESRNEVEPQNSDESKLEARTVPVKNVTQPHEDQRPTADAPLKLKPRAMYVDRGSEDDASRKVLTEDEQEFINFGPYDKDEFRSRLSVLLINQKQNPALKKLGEGGTPKPEAAGVSSSANRPSMSRSTSEPSFVLLLNKLGGGGESPQESETDEPEEKARSEHSSLAPGIPPAPKFDQTLFNTIRAGAIPNTPRTPIPDAPKFDPVLFNTLGKGKIPRESILPDPEQQERELEQMKPVKDRPAVAAVTPVATTVPVTPPVGKYYEVELKKLKRIAPSIPVQAPKAAGEPDPESNPRQAFKSRLEQILQRGPLEVPGRPKTLTPNLMGAISADNIAATSRISLQQCEQQLPGASSTDSGLGMLTSSTVSVSSSSESAQGSGDVNSSVNTSENVSVKRDESFRDRARGFDTAKKKQKLIFDDVLKSINPETRPSSIRNSVEHRVSFRNFKEGLRKTVPPKQFLPDA
uniref:Uncharacterized protein n=2 Tax=Anopheles albimanus TaxID=7167 RepID=A0A182FUK4_ANOAL